MWQDISTAPKDGTEILACRMYEGSRVALGVAVWTAPWPQHDGYRVNYGRATWLRSNREKLFPDPTHWMPLPPPPATGGT